MLYSRLWRRASRPPLLYYGQVALVEEEYQEIMTPSLQKRGMNVVILSDVVPGKENKNNKTKKRPNNVIIPDELPTWLGMQQWNGGVGVFVVGSSRLGDDTTIAVQQHMAFRSSGAIFIMNQGDSSNGDGIVSNTFTSQDKKLVHLQIPQYLQSSSSMAEASFKALGYSRRLKLHHVLLQQVKDLFHMSYRGIRKGNE